MTGLEWADFIGMPIDSAPLRDALDSHGIDTSNHFYEDPDRGLSLHFQDGRLAGAEFDPMIFPDVPFGWGVDGTVPSGFEHDPTSRFFVKQIGPYTARVLGDFGIVIFVSVHRFGDLTEDVEKFSVVSSDVAGDDFPTIDVPPESGVPIGYKTSWFAVQETDAETLQTAFGLKNPTPMGGSDGAGQFFPFLGAAANGWRVLSGHVVDDPIHGASVAKRISTSLGTRVAFFSSDRVIDGYAWCVVDGDTYRLFWTEDGEVKRDEGDPLSGEPTHLDEETLRAFAALCSTGASVPLEEGLVFKRS